MSAPQYGTTQWSLQGNSCASMYPRELLGVSGLWEKFSWCVCSGSWLCTWCKHTWAVADPELAVCWPSPRQLAQPGPWKERGRHHPPPPQVGGVAWVLPGALTYLHHVLCSNPKQLLQLLANYFSCFARMFNSFFQCFWILHASGSFFFPPQVHLKNKPFRISSISSVAWFWIFQQAVEQILLWPFVC